MMTIARKPEVELNFFRYFSRSLAEFEKRANGRELKDWFLNETQTGFILVGVFADERIMVELKHDEK